MHNFVEQFSVFLSPWNSIAPMKPIFLGDLGFFTGRTMFSRTLFSVFYAPFFYGHPVCFFFAGKNLVARGEFKFVPQSRIFSQLTQPNDKIFFANPNEIEYKSIIFRDQWSFFTHTFDFSRAHFFKLSRARIFSSRVEFYQNFHGHFSFFKHTFSHFYSRVPTFAFLRKKKYWNNPYISPS